MQEPKGHWNITSSYFLIGDSSLVSHLVFYIFSKWIQPVGYRWIARDTRPSPRGAGPALIRLPSKQREQISLLWASTYKREKAAGYMITDEQWPSVYYHPVEEDTRAPGSYLFLWLSFNEEECGGAGEMAETISSASLKWQQYWLMFLFYGIMQMIYDDWSWNIPLCHLGESLELQWPKH